RSSRMCTRAMLVSGLERKRQKVKTHRFPCQGAYAPNRWVSFCSCCQVLQLLRLEAATRERLLGGFSVSVTPRATLPLFYLTQRCRAGLPLFSRLGRWGV